MRILAAGLAAMLSACAGIQSPPRDRATDAASQSVIDAAQRLFDAMEAKDTLALQRLLHPQAQIIVVADGRARFAPGGRDAWIRSIGAAAERLRERMWDPRVEIDGDLATLWAPYDFHVGERLSHCGVDAFQFVREGATWRMLVVTYTRRTEGCTKPGS